MSSELREDALSDRLVLVAPGRAARPHTTAEATRKHDTGECPFCPGHEDQTPPETYRTGGGAPDSPGWRVRVFPNLFPIVAPDAAPGATGAHEVVVLSPDHDRSFARLTAAQALEVMTVLRDRARYHADAGRRHVQALINYGRAAGASIAHPHAQLLALDIVPPGVLAAEGRFAVADLLLADRDDAVERGLVVSDGETSAASAASAWCPWASPSPWLVRVAVPDAGPRFELATDEQVRSVTAVLHEVLGAVAETLSDAPYNVVVQNGPTDSAARWSRWYVEVVPRVSAVAGFELGTGIFVNSASPDAAAEQLSVALQRAERT
jgi:UDPglucose--hexose-1-phosphate uridylyltransferase